MTVEYALSGQGYHRTLKATLRSDGEYSVSNEAAYLIYINVTSDIYLDLDQVCFWCMYTKCIPVSMCVCAVDFTDG